MSVLRTLAAGAIPAAAAAALLYSSQGRETAHAEKSAAAKVGEFNASGLIFKDVVQVTAFPDPKIEGITLHVSNVKRSLAERLSKDFFTDPSQVILYTSSSASNAVIFPDFGVSIANRAWHLCLWVRRGRRCSVRRKTFSSKPHTCEGCCRIYDDVNNAIVYVAYSTRLSQDMSEQNSRYRTSVSTVSLYGQDFSLRESSE